MTEGSIRFLPNGDAALVVEFGDEIDLATNAKVVGLAERVAEVPVPGVIETVPTFRSLLISFDPSLVSFRTLVERVSRRNPGAEPFLGCENYPRCRYRIGTKRS